MKAISNHCLNLEFYILAGGLSTRMGQGQEPPAPGPAEPCVGAHSRGGATTSDFRCGPIRRDSISRSGPIGGIYTALQSSKADAVLFLACDMPFVSADFLQRLIRALTPSSNAVFASEGRLAGFPCLLRRENCLPIVSQQITRSEFSLRALAKILKAKNALSVAPRFAGVDEH